MAGRAEISGDCLEDPRILALSEDGTWKIAKHPLHYDKPEKAGAGPALAFAKAVLVETSA